MRTKFTLNRAICSKTKNFRHAFNQTAMKKTPSVALQKINPEVVLTITFLLMILIFIVTF